MRKLLVIAGCAVALSANVFGGNIIVNNDEWTLSNDGYTDAGANNAATYATNAAQFLTGVASGANILIDSDNFGLDGSSLASSLSAYNVTDSGTFTAYTAASLLGYSAVFVGGDVLTQDEISALTTYVDDGGSVYIAAGTGDFGGSAAEAATFNPFLNAFGLTLSSSYNNVVGNETVSSNSPVLSGVSQLFYDNGNDVSLFGTNANAAVITSTGFDGLIGTYSGASVINQASATPEPASFLLIGAGMVALALRKRARV